VHFIKFAENVFVYTGGFAVPGREVSVRATREMTCKVFSNATTAMYPSTKGQFAYRACYHLASRTPRGTPARVLVLVLVLVIVRVRGFFVRVLDGVRGKGRRRTQIEAMTAGGVFGIVEG